MRSLPSHLWHALPLHYAPHLFYTGILCSQAELKRRGYPVVPRRTAARRDRKLRLDDYVHLSPQPDTPLLADKCARGYPHVLIAFGSALLKEEGQISLCRYNAKSWRHREDFAPVTDADAQGEVWKQWQTGRYPSLEVLVRQTLPLTPHAQTVHVPDEWSGQWLASFGALFAERGTLPHVVASALFPRLTTYDTAELTTYLEACRAAEAIAPPPELPFD